MWGAFSDIAKAAQDFQEQASTAASTLSAATPTTTGTTAGSLFSLDSMQKPEEVKPNIPVDERPVIGSADLAPATTTTTPATTSCTASSDKGGLLPAVPLGTIKKLSPIPSGKLKVPSSAAKLQIPGPTIVNEEPAVEQPANPPKEESNDTNEPSAVAIAGDDGWDDEGGFGELEFDENSGKDPSESNTGSGAAAAAAAGIFQNDHVLDEPTAKEGPIPVQDVHDGDTSEQKIVPDVTATAAASSGQPQSEARPSVTEDSKDQSMITQVDDHVHEGSLKELDVVNTFEAETALADNSADADPTAASLEGERKLVVLISTQSLDKQVSVRQDKVFTVLNSNGISYETMDGADPERKDLRDELFACSGRRGEYPQFFFVRLTDGIPSFWGGWEQFELANDDGTIVSQLAGNDRPSGTATNSSDPATEQQAAPSDDVLEHFSRQMQRLEENYQAERLETEAKHKLELEKVRKALSHDAVEEARKLEKRLMAQMDEKEKEINELARSNEGYKLKLDVLKREVEGTQQLLDSKTSDISKASDAHSQDKKVLVDKIRAAESAEFRTRRELEEVKRKYETAAEDLNRTKNEHSELLGRSKLLAGELKERRVECRELSARVDELTELKEGLQGNLETLQSQIFHQDRSQTEKDEELEQLKAKLVDANTEREKLVETIEEKTAQGEKALADYKKKAQGSLAMANSRTAAAVQAKEDAELEARAARSTSDSAMERAVKAEISSREALAEAKVYVKDMEREKGEIAKEHEKAEKTLKEAQDLLATTKEQFEQELATSKQLSDKLKLAVSETEAEHLKASRFQADFLESQQHVKKLREEVEKLQELLRRSEEAAASRTENEEAAAEVKIQAPITPPRDPDKPSDDATIMSLQLELAEAKESIEELKAALKNAVEMNEKSSGEQQDELGGSNRSRGQHSRDATSNGGNESTPLFFAMEKQAELKTARNEIQRLANLLADVQSGKMEAHDRMEEMRQSMEQAEARLKRFEKLSSAPSFSGSVSSDPPSPAVASNGTERRSSGAVNIEYLKNIMLSYLNAKSLAERKRLVPVIGAVLCLTADELKQAKRSVEESASLGGVGTSFFESITGKS